MTDIRQQLQEFCEGFDEAMLAIEVDEVFEERVGGGAVRAMQPRRAGRRPVPGWAIAAVSAVVAVSIGAVILLLRPPAQDEVVTTDAPTTTVPAPGTTVPVPTTAAVASTTTTVLLVDPPVSTWERIDAPGAFDLAEGYFVGSAGWPTEATPGQTIETILAIEDCPQGPGCGEVAVFVAGGRTGMRRPNSSIDWVTSIHGPSDAAIWISEDGRNWTAVTGPGFTGEHGQRITALASDGRRIVAVGAFNHFRSPLQSERALVWYSDDLGRTWTEVEDESLITDQCRWANWDECFPSGMTDVAWTGEGFVAVGDGFWFSPDGISWERTGELEHPQVAAGLSRWGSSWIAVGRGPAISMPGEPEIDPMQDSAPVLQDSAAVWISEDARSWELVFVDDTNWGLAADVVPGPDGLVAVGQTWAGYANKVLPAAWRSDGGTSWEEIYPAEEEIAPAPRPWAGGATMDDVVRIDEWLIATNASYLDMWASPDGGTSWIDIPLGFAGFDYHQDRILDVEVLPFPSGGEPKLIATGFHRTDAAIWVGTLEE